MKRNLILIISLTCCFGYNPTIAQINLIEQFENGFTSDTEEPKPLSKQSKNLSKSNNFVTNMNLNQEGMTSDLIKRAREFENLKNEQLKNPEGNYETIETLNFALEAIRDLICSKMARGELYLNNENTLNMDCDNL
jgi:hypothetical protein